MKKTLIYAALLLIAACSKPAPVDPVPVPPEPKEYGTFAGDISDETLGIRETLLACEVSLPASFAGVLHSDELSIRAQGFREGDKLYFISDDGTGFEALSVSPSGDALVFHLPEKLYPGDWNLRLVRGEEYQNLGCRTVICDNPASLEGQNVRGKVSCEGVALPRVVVSDGFRMTVTDLNGEYRLCSKKENGYVFITCPGDCRPPLEYDIPQSHKYLGDVQQTDVVDFELERVDNSRHRIIFMTDLHISNYTNGDITWYKKVIVPEIEAAVKETNVPSYIFSAGDATTDHRWYSFNFALPEWRELASTLPAPLYQTMGNHDNEPYSTTDFVAEVPFKKTIGPSWFSVNIGDIHYIILDNIIYGVNDHPEGETYYVRVTEAQKEWLRRDLLMTDKDTPLVVVMHSPLYHYVTPTALKAHFYNQAMVREVLDCFEGFECVHFVDGHKHTNHNIILSESMMEHNLAATSGSNWNSEVQSGTHYSRDGSRGGIQIWDMDSRNIRWVHKSPGSPVSQGQFHIEDLNVVPADRRGEVPANTVLVNIYNWDPKWKLSITENGRELKWTQVYREDPYYILACPEKWSSVMAPTGTEHIFTATASAPDTPVTVRVTDRFGNEYIETLTRPGSYDLSKAIKFN